MHQTHEVCLSICYNELSKKNVNFSLLHEIIGNSYNII